MTGADKFANGVDKLADGADKPVLLDKEKVGLVA
jgi:X-X-X-Leu-X-X-Gly heptad repeat protein